MPKPKRRSRSGLQSVSPGTAITNTPSPSSPSRRELLLVAMLLLLGVGLRFAFPSQMAVEHFDEGVYASNIFFGSESGHQYPMRRFYAPPLLPSLIEYSMIFDHARHPASRRFSSLAPLLPSLLAGCLTLLLLWGMTREWFGPQAGLATLALAALSDFHAMYSRAALTEALLLLFFVAAVWALKRAFSTGSYVAVGLGGLLTGMAWWTKYNGWLPLAVGFGGLTIALTLDAKTRVHAVRLTACWLATAAIAFAVWSPYLFQLQSYGGYAEVAANHRQYVVGLGGWVSSLLQQHANLSHFDGWATCAAVGAAVLLAGSAQPYTRRYALQLASLALGLSAASAWLGAAVVLFALSLWFVGTELLRRWRASDADDAPHDLALYCLAAWLAGLFLATPLYHPYPRLTLPWLCAIWVGAGVALNRLVETKIRRDEHRGVTKRWVIGFAISLLAASAALPRIAEHGWPAWQSRAGWVPVSREIIAEVGQRAIQARGNRNEAIVLVYGEPGLFFQLNVDGGQVFQPVADLGVVGRPLQEVPVPIFLVTGPHAERTAGFQEDFSRHAAYLQRISDYVYRPSDLVLLNQSDPRSAALQQASTRSPQITLYEVVHGRK